MQTEIAKNALIESRISIKLYTVCGNKTPFISKLGTGQNETS